MPRPSQHNFNLKRTIWRAKQRSQATNSTNQMYSERVSQTRNYQ